MPTGASGRAAAPAVRPAGGPPGVKASSIGMRKAWKASVTCSGSVRTMPSRSSTRRPCAGVNGDRSRSSATSPGGVNRLVRNDLQLIAFGASVRACTRHPDFQGAAVRSPGGVGRLSDYRPLAGTSPSSVTVTASLALTVARSTVSVTTSRQCPATWRSSRRSARTSTGIPDSGAPSRSTTTVWISIAPPTCEKRTLGTQSDI